MCSELSGVQSDNGGLWVEELKMITHLKCRCEKNKMELFCHCSSVVEWLMLCVVNKWIIICP